MIEEESTVEASGLPGWVMTFADLMSLLMCFFVLLLSFSEMDVQKFKQLAGSMKNAFGVQKTMNVKDIPAGTSIIAQEFSPGKPVPTSINEMRQQTTDDLKRTLDFSDSESKGKEDLEVDALEKKDEGDKEGIGDAGTSNYNGVDNAGDSFLEGVDEEGKVQTAEEVEKAKELIDQQLREKIENEAEEIRNELKQELERGIIEVEVIEDEVLIRIREKGSFPSGNADIRKSFYPIMNKIGKMLKSSVKGRVVVAGHTDNVPIFTSQYPSNWVLSAARSANVVHYLSKYSKVPHERMEIRAHAETKPLAPNDNYENMARNRRVEIIIKYDQTDLTGEDYLAISSELEETGAAAISKEKSQFGDKIGSEQVKVVADEREPENSKLNSRSGTINAGKDQVTEGSLDKVINSEDEIKALEALLNKINNVERK